MAEAKSQHLMWQRELEVREILRQAPTVELAKRGKTLIRTDSIEWALFWIFVAGLAWIPYWYGSNLRVTWGINAALFPGLAVVYEISLLARSANHPVAIKELWVSAVLLVAVVLWIFIQNATWTPSSWHHPIWGMAADTLHSPVEGSISVNRDLTTFALARLITAASVFWLSVQLCRNLVRANWIVAAIATIGAGYAGYGLVNYSLATEPLAWFGNTSAHGFVTSTFYNHNHYATYAGLGLIAMCGLILRRYRNKVTFAGENIGFWISSFIEASGQMGAVLLCGAILIFVALLYTVSRGGILATGLGLSVLGLLWFGQRNMQSVRLRKTAISRAVIVMLAMLVVGSVAFLVFGDIIFGKVAEQGLRDDQRMAVYTITLRSILVSPWLGYGYGAFEDVFPMFRDQSIGILDIWRQAHCTYLEVFEGLGIVFGSMLLVSVFLLVWKCLTSAVVYRKGAMVCCVAASAAFLVGVHALVDFSLQMQAVALTFMALLGAGVAQSMGSRPALK